MKNAFTVKVYPNGSQPLVLNGGRDPFGIYIELITPSGSGYAATPGRRMDVALDDLVALPAGSGADFEYKHQLPADSLKR